MRYFQLRAFDAVASQRGFSKAARTLGLTQPAVTMQVRNLEMACGQALFDRKAGAIELTEPGKALFELTRSLFAAEEEVEEFVGAANAMAHGSLRLAADGPHVALLVVRAFRERYPGITVSVSLGSQRVTWDEVLGHQADIAILGNAPADPRVMHLPLVRQGMVALLPRGHPRVKRKTLRLADVAGHPLIRREPGSNTRRLVDDALRRAKLALPTAIEVGSREAVREAVRLGLGIGFMLEREVGTDRGTVAVPIEELRDCNTDALVCLNSQRKRRIVRSFVDIAAELRL